MIQPISVFNQSSLVSTAELTACMAAINNVAMPMFAKVWGLQAELMFDKPAGAWAMWILDRSPIQGDLAFHINQAGIPIIQVFAETIREDGADLCQDMCHEVDETLADPTAAATVPFPGGDEIVKETDDPVSGDKIPLGGGLNGSNFVYPSWFDPNGKPPYDQLGLCMRPFEIRPGGYVEQKINGVWQIAAVRGLDFKVNPRTQRHSRLSYRARNRAP